MTGKYNSSFDIREPRCVKCNSKNIKRLSASANRMEYHCQDCQKCFKGEICVVNDVSLKSSSKNVIQCPRCNDLNIIFGGKRRNKTQLKQSYICKNCGRHFVENAKYFSSKYLLEGNISLEKMCQGDIWDIRILGLEPRANQNYTLNFSKIKPDWLKSATKKWIKQKSSTASGATLLTYLVGIRKFGSTELNLRN
ncbi:MAG: hypothetical protein QNJ38_04920 [Prochloraceae cyanobacterium]|nr:hypothetical protein [Prochloraceae cyanobacterium]